jgi:hypothetical protein
VKGISFRFCGISRSDDSFSSSTCGRSDAEEVVDDEPVAIPSRAILLVSVWIGDVP